MASFALLDRRGKPKAWVQVDEEDLHFGTYRWGPAGRSGYASRLLQKSPAIRVYLHRLILGLERGNPLWADHIDGDPLNCRRCNLRAITPAQNAQNRRGYGRSQYRGVVWSKSTQRWQAQVNQAGRCHYLGLYDNEEDAAAVAAAFRKEHMPYAR